MLAIVFQTKKRQISFLISFKKLYTNYTENLNTVNLKINCIEQIIK